MRSLRGAAFALLFGLCLVAFLGAQSVSPALVERLEAERSILRFEALPDSLSLLPSFPGEKEFRERHRALSPHLVEEGLFLLPNRFRPLDADTIRRLLDAVPSLAGLRARDERTGKEIRLFDRAEVMGEPSEREGRVRFVLETADREFGTSRFDVALSTFDGRVEMTMVNLDSLRYLIFPAARPGKAVLDLLYFPYGDESAVYLAWSVRAVLYVPGFMDIEKPLRRRILAIKDWYVGQLGTDGQ